VALAITRAVSPAIQHCELTHLSRQPIDLEAAMRQHESYEQCLVDLGCELLRLPAGQEMPDSVFVEDTAIVLDHCAVIARPGAESRRQETQAVAEVLGGYRTLFHINTPGTIDGGDVLVIGRNLYVGLSSRTNFNGMEQLRALVSPLGYHVNVVPVKDCLHLKTAVSRVGTTTLLINSKWVDSSSFEGMNVVEVDPREPMAANALLIGERVVYAASHKRTRERLEGAGISVHTVDVSELAKAEGGVTCCSLIVDVSHS